MGLGVVQVLCQLAHIADSKQRISALWALKHVTDSATSNEKMSIIDGLGPSWMLQVIGGDGSQHPSHRSQLATPNAAGEQVDILNEVDEEPAMEVDEASDGAFSDHHDSLEGQSLPSVPPQHRERLLAIKDEEESPRVRAKKDDIRIEEQVLDILRNAISEAAPSQPDMIDYLLLKFGSVRLFECLENKLRPSRPQTTSSAMLPTAHAGISMPAGKRPTLTTPGGSGLSVANNKSTIDQFPLHLYTHPTLLEVVMFILVHIANGTVAHKHMLLSQPLSNPAPLPHIANIFPSQTGVTPRFIDLIVPLFSHPHRKIRVVCCWFVHNILWQEDKNDEADTRRRALDLRKRGFEESVKRCAADVDLDVRERARSCVGIWARLLGDGSEERRVTAGRVWGSESR